MGKRPEKYIGKDAENFISGEFSTEQLAEMYNMTKDQARTRKNKLKRRLAKKIGKQMEREPNIQPDKEIDGVPIEKLAGMLGEMLTEYGISAEDVESISSVEIRDGEHVGMAVNRDTGEIETVALPNKRRKIVFKPTTKFDLSEFISQADPVKISPSRRKHKDKGYDIIYAFGDAQIDYINVGDGEWIPTHSEESLDLHLQIARELNPSTIVNLGDSIDLAALSRFDPKTPGSNHSMRKALNRVHQHYAQLRADHPNAHILEVDSNHNARLRKFVMKHAQAFDQLYVPGMEQEYPVMSYPFLANLGAVGVEWVSGYGAAEYVYGEDYEAPPIVFKHGMTTAGQGSVSIKEAKENPETHIVRGHGHQAETIYRTNRAGQYMAYVQVAASCSIEGAVPGYASAIDDRGVPVRKQQKWQNGGLIITDYRNGVYDFNHVIFQGNNAFLNGKEYTGELPE